MICHSMNIHWKCLLLKLLEDKGYIHISGNNIAREKSEVLLVDDLKDYLRTKYVGDGLTKNEINNTILSLRAVSGTLYEANKAILSMIMNGFIFNREDRAKKISLLN